MKAFYILLICAMTLSSANAQRSTAKIDSVILSLKKQKDKINAYSLNHKSSFVLLAKITGKKELVTVINEKWPENVECAYNILKGPQGNIIMIMSSPTSESGDWDLECTYYFNDDGHTIIYEKQANVFALPDDEVAYETIVDYFAPDFSLIKHTDELVDKNGKELDKKLYSFDFKRRGLEQKILPDVTKCLENYHIYLPR